VFCASLSDVGEDHPAWIAPRARLFALVHETPWLDWLLLTKRPENMVSLWERAATCRDGVATQRLWPDNVWVGTTVEDQKRADERIPELLKVPAAQRFLSCEPLLERVDLSAAAPPIRGRPSLARLDYVIVGGESGPGARPFALEWARDIVAQCKAARVAVHVKQLGAQPTLDGGLVQLRHRRKGGDLSEFPADLRLRDEWPDVIPF
jgi:protein gp37